MIRLTVDFTIEMGQPRVHTSEYHCTFLTSGTVYCTKKQVKVQLDRFLNNNEHWLYYCVRVCIKWCSLSLSLARSRQVAVTFPFVTDLHKMATSLVRKVIGTNNFVVTPEERVKIQKYQHKADNHILSYNPVHKFINVTTTHILQCKCLCKRVSFSRPQILLIIKTLNV